MILPFLLLLAQSERVVPHAPPDTQLGRRIAILIGNNAYSRKPLSTGVSEAARMQSAFDSLGFETVLYANAGLGELRFAISDVATTLTSADTVVVYFHGYSMQADGDNLLLPIDFKATNKLEAKGAACSASALLDSLKQAQASLLILDPGGEQPFEIVPEKVAPGLASMKARKNAFLLFGATPGKSIAPSSGLFARALREALGQASLTIDALASLIQAKSEVRQATWTSAGSRAVAETVLHLPGGRSVTPAAQAGTKELTWDDIRFQLENVKSLLPARRSIRSRNRGQALAVLDAEYGPSRKDAARAAQKDEFETTPQYLARTRDARAAAEYIEANYKAERDRLETIFRDPTGDPDPKALESLQAQRFRGPCKAEWAHYDADREALVLFVGGADREYNMSIAEAKEFKTRSSRLTCEGGLTPESVTVSDPAGKLKLVETPQPKAIPFRGNSGSGVTGVTAPGITFRVEPEYSEVARQARVQGSVILGLIIDVNGLPRSIRVIRPIGFGLDEKAVEAVRKWRFRPGTKGGLPHPVQSTIEVNFRLL